MNSQIVPQNGTHLPRQAHGLTPDEQTELEQLRQKQDGQRIIDMLPIWVHPLPESIAPPELNARLLIDADYTRVRLETTPGDAAANLDMTAIRDYAGKLMDDLRAATW